MIYTYETSPAEDAALASKIAAYNTGLQTPVTVQELIGMMTVKPFMTALVEGHERAILATMIPIGQRILAAAGGDTVKAASALEAGERAAIESLN